mmetsp:Transcript_10448/g.32408  ORF Transcript_10448/g.32408 Transcript_10448/m.32408 type:complete len:98 (+) Transcript_10448:34-327(+)
MVKLAPEFFADAAAQMRAHAGVDRTRLALKVRQRDGIVSAKTTDGTTTLTTTVRTQGEFKVLERIIGEYVSACTAFAPASLGEDTGKAGKKGKKGKK